MPCCLRSGAAAPAAERPIDKEEPPRRKQQQPGRERVPNGDLHKQNVPVGRRPAGLVDPWLVKVVANWTAALLASVLGAPRRQPISWKYN